MADIIETWLAQAGSAHTRRAYSTSIRIFEAKMHVTWQTATAAHIQDFRHALLDAGRKPTTVASRIAALSSLYECAIDHNLVTANPCRHLRQRRGVRRYHSAHPLTEAQAQALLAACDVDTLSGARDYALMLTFLLSGYRSAETLRLCWGDIEEIIPPCPTNAAPGLYMVNWLGKGAKERTEPFSSDAFAALSAYLQRAGRWPPAATAYIWQPLHDRGCANFPNVTAPLASDRHISPAQANRILRKLLTRGMTPAQASTYSIHDLRQTFAHICAENGVDPYRLQGLLHHEKLTTTLIYIDQMRRAVDDSASRMVAGRLGVAESRPLRPVAKANV